MATEWENGILLTQLADEPALSEELAIVSSQVESAPSALEGDPRAVVLDCSQLTYLNSSNISQFLQLRSACESQGFALRLASVSEQIWSVLSVTGLDKMFRIAPDVMTALAGVQLEQSDDS